MNNNILLRREKNNSFLQNKIENQIGVDCLKKQRALYLESKTENRVGDALRVYNRIRGNAKNLSGKVESIFGTSLGSMVIHSQVLHFYNSVAIQHFIFFETDVMIRGKYTT